MESTWQFWHFKSKWNEPFILSASEGDLPTFWTWKDLITPRKTICKDINSDWECRLQEPWEDSEKTALHTTSTFLLFPGHSLSTTIRKDRIGQAYPHSHLPQ